MTEHSATNDNRPAFQEMIQDAKKQMFDYVLVHKLDRFHDRYDKAYYKRELLNMNIKNKFKDDDLKYYESLD